MFDRMIDLLRRRPNQFDAAFALSILPESVKIDAIAPFLNYSIREMLHEKRMKQVPSAFSIFTHLLVIVREIAKTAFGVWVFVEYVVVRLKLTLYNIPMKVIRIFIYSRLKSHYSTWIASLIK